MKEAPARMKEAPARNLSGYRVIGSTIERVYSDTTLFHKYLHFLMYRLFHKYSYFLIISPNGFLRCESASPKLSSSFFVRKEPDN
jgi:hypothetical protein